MKKAFFKKIIILAAVFVLAITSVPFTVGAAGAAAVLSVQGAYFGGTTLLTLTFAGEDIGAVSADITYDDDVLEYIQTDNTHMTEPGKIRVADVASSSGQTSISFTLSFTALSAGNTTVSVTSSKVLAFGTEKEIGSPTTSTSFDIIDIRSITLDCIELTAPAKSIYRKNEALDTTGMTVTAKYLDGHTADVTASAAVSGYNAATLGDQTVTVTYNGKTADFTVTVFGIKTVSLTLLGKIVINFNAEMGTLVNKGYTPGVLFFRTEPNTAAIEAAYAADEGISEYVMNNTYYMFSYDDIAAKEMNDLVYCVPYVEKGDAVFFANTTSMSAAKFTTMAFQTYNNSKLRKMLVDMLNYGSAAQVYFNYNTGALAKNELTSSQKQYGTGSNVRLSSALKKYEDSVTSEQVTIKTVSLTLENEISINYKAEVLGEGIKKAEILVFNDYKEGNTYDKTTASKTYNMSLNEGYYFGSVTGIPAKNMRDIIFARVHVEYNDGTEAYSSILQYNIESYAYAVRNGSYMSSLKNLTEAMMKYSDSAAAYFAA